MLTKNLPVKAIVQFSIVPVILFIVWSTVVVCAFKFLHFEWLAIPFLPVSVLGIAVSFYVGFKNNASNERQNEARKNWGAITNDSRALVAMLNSYLPAENDEGKGRQEPNPETAYCMALRAQIDLAAQKNGMGA